MNDYRDAILGEASFIEAHSRVLQRARGDAEDLEQDLWVALLVQQPERRDSLRPWIATVAQRISMNRRRGETLRQDREIRYFQDSMVERFSELPGSMPEAAAQLASIIARLPQSSRAILKLRYEENQSFTRIGERLGIPEKTARTRHFRILESVRAQMAVADGARGRGGRRHAWFVATLRKWRVSAPTSKLTFAACAVLIAVSGLIFTQLALRSGGSPSRPTVAILEAAQRPPSPLRLVPKSANSGPGRISMAADFLPGPGEMEVVGAADERVLSVRVVDVDGNPVSGAAVDLLEASRDEHAVVTVVRSIVVGVDGTASVAGASLETWLVARDEESGRSPAFSCALPLETGAAMELVVHPTSNLIRGRVVDEAGRPIEDCLVQGLNSTFMGAKRSTSAALHRPIITARSRTGPRGAFELPGRIGIGRPALQISAPGFATLALRLPEGGDVILHPARHCEGLVVDESGTPVAGAELVLRLAGSMVRRRSVSGADGRFRLEDVPVGDCTLEAERGILGASMTLTLESCEPELVLVRVSSNSAISGLLVDSLGHPLSGWAVEAAVPAHEEADLQLQAIHRLRSSRWKTTDQNGRFAFAIRPSGACLIRALDPDSGQIAAAEVIAPRARSVELTSDVQERAIALEGYVSLECGSIPECRSVVHLLHDRSSTLLSTRVDPQTGRFRFDGLPPGRAVTQWIRSGRVEAPLMPVEVPIDMPLRFRASEKDGLLFHLQCPDGTVPKLDRISVVSGRVARKYGSKSGGLNEVRIDPSGMVRVPVLGVGAHTYYFVAGGRRLAACCEVSATSLHNAPISLTLSPKQDVKLRVDTSGWKHVMRHRVAFITDSRERVVRRLIVARAGGPEVLKARALLAPGRHLLHLEREDQEFVTLPFVVPAFSSDDVSTVFLRVES